MRTRSVSTLVAAAVVVVAAAAGAACSDTSEPAGASGAGETTVTREPTASGGSDVTAPDATADVTAQATQGALDTIATVAPDGVPGIESADVFCRAWSEFGGSFQALALAGNLARDPTTARRVELAAASAVTGAWAAMDDHFPDEVGSAGRSEFLDGLLGPFARRAAAAESALREAGLTAEQVRELGELWIETLTEVGLGDPDIAVNVPAGMRPAFDAAVADFTADVPPIPADPSLITDVPAQQATTYIATHCPDQGTLAGIDIVGD